MKQSLKKCKKYYIVSRDKYIKIKYYKTVIFGEVWEKWSQLTD